MPIKLVLIDTEKLSQKLLHKIVIDLLINLICDYCLQIENLLKLNSVEVFMSTYISITLTLNKCLIEMHHFGLKHCVIYTNQIQITLILNW